MKSTLTPPFEDANESVSAGARFVGKLDTLPGYQKFAPQRIAYVCVVYAVMWIVVFAAHNLLHTVPENVGAFVGIFIAALVLAVAMFALTRTSINTSLLLDLGLVFEVVGAFLIAYIEVMSIQIPDTRIIGISNVCVFVAAFPFFVPSTFGKSMLASIAAASTGPLAYLIHAAMGAQLPPTAQIVSLYAPNYLAAGISFFPIYLLNKDRSDLQQARRMGSYQLVERLGHGGMGEVWKAHHDMLARSAMIKMIRPGLVGERSPEESRRVLRRFHREAQSTAALESPHTVKLFDFGLTGGGTFYYVMEMLYGVDLENLVERFGPVPAGRAVGLLRQACQSLAEAHESGLIHRDIKPANIFACRLGRQYDFVKLIDFGLVKRTYLGEGESKLTADGLIHGTPAFIAPEMVASEEKIDGRADIYSLGCVAYWLLTGKLVFEGSNQMKMVMDHVQTAPVPPSQRTELEIPPALEEVVMACLEKEPSKRPKDADDLDRRLTSVDLAESWTKERAEKWWRVHLPEYATKPVSQSLEEEQR
jgi:serine/threonine-protein kinase